MARQRLLSPGVGVGERLLATKLEILRGTGTRRPSPALTLLTGGATPTLLEPATFDPEPTARQQRHLAPRTVYLADQHVRAIDRIIQLTPPTTNPRRLTRSAVLRAAVEHLRTLVESETDSHPCLIF